MDWCAFPEREMSHADVTSADVIIWTVSEYSFNEFIFMTIFFNKISKFKCLNFWAIWILIAVESYDLGKNA